jgi:hypothetical protein
MQDAEDEPLFAERVAGLDIAKAGVDVAIRVPSDSSPGRRQQETWDFGTTPGNCWRWRTGCAAGA